MRRPLRFRAPRRAKTRGWRSKWRASLFGMRARERSTLVLGALLSFACSGGAFETAGESRETISGGALDSTHRAVYREFTHWPADDGVSACTATLIAPNLLLTARHCISSSDRERVQCGRAE